MSKARWLCLRPHTSILFLLLTCAVTQARADKNDRDVMALKKNTKIEQVRNARILQLDKGVTTAQVLQLRDDQILETKSGRKMTVGSYRRIQQLFTSARTKSALRRELPVPIFPAAHGTGVPIRLGETPQQLLARSDKEAIRLPSGRVVSGKQMKALVPYVERAYGVDLHAGPPTPSGRAVKIKHPKDLTALKNAPDSTIIESHKGTRTTLGALRRALGAPGISSPPGIQSLQEGAR